MNLTKQHKSDMVSSVANDIPRKYSGRNAMREAMEKVIKADHLKQAPTKLRAMLEDKEMSIFLHWHTLDAYYLLSAIDAYGDKVNFRSKAAVELHQMAVLNGNARYIFNVAAVHGLDLSEPCLEQLRAIGIEFLKEELAIRDAKTKLEAALAPVRTRKQFLTAFPELEKYAPAEEPKATLLPAVANVIADLSKLGWPKEAAAQASQVADVVAA